MFTLIIIPVLAKSFGRVSLPICKNPQIQPLNIFTCLLNRHYVKPELLKLLNETAIIMDKKFPGSKINYLDANFPFIDEFPLLPHLSHDDGKKLDLAFYYIDAKSNKPSNKSPSWIGYGICEGPKSFEENRPEKCKENGYWMYNILSEIMPQENKQNFIFDEARTKTLIEFMASKEKTEKIFIEPHLKSRMNLKSNKISLHGCQAVRHDDHIHIQIK